MPLTLPDALRDAARTRPEAIALRSDHAQWSYAQLYEQASGFAAWLREVGVGPGERVCLLLGNVAEFAVYYYGVWFAGGIVVPLNPLERGSALEHRLNDCRPALLLSSQEFASAAHHPAQRLEVRHEIVEASEPRFAGEPTARDGVSTVGSDPVGSDPAAILYGRTDSSQPWGVVLSHDNLAWSSSVASTMLPLAPSDNVLCWYPLVQTIGQTCGLNATVSAGGCLSVLPTFGAAETLRVIDEQRITVLCAFPALLKRFRGSPEFRGRDLSSLHTVLAWGKGGLGRQVRTDLESAFGCSVREGYGWPESSGLACFNHPDRLPQPGSVGTPAEGVELRVVDERGADVPNGETGELVLRGRNVMTGYWQRPEQTATAFRDGWLRTGAGAHRDAAGCYYVVESMGVADFLPKLSGAAGWRSAGPLTRARRAAGRWLGR